MENPLQENDLVSGTILNTDGEARIQVRVPKRIIHCSDGVLEEYSDEETDDNKPSVDPVLIYSYVNFNFYKSKQRITCLQIILEKSHLGTLAVALCVG